MNFTSPYSKSEECEVGQKDREGGFEPAPRPVLDPLPHQLQMKLVKLVKLRDRTGVKTRRLLL